jgi:hypothetical protein
MRSAPDLRLGATVGRPTKLTPKVAETIVQALRAGNFIDTACRLGGISPSTYYAWRQESTLSRCDSRVSNFIERVEMARAEAESANVEAIQQAAQRGTWQAAAWFLERSYSERWGRSETAKRSTPPTPEEVDRTCHEAWENLQRIILHEQSRRTHKRVIE